MDPQDQNKTPLVGEEKKDDIVRTFAEDMTEVLGDGGGGVVKKIIAEEEEREKEKREISPESNKNKVFLTLGLTLFLASLLIILYLFLTREPETVPVDLPYTPMIFLDNTEFVEVDNLEKDRLSRAVYAEFANTDVKNGGIEGIFLTIDKKIVGLRQFLSLLKASASLGESNIVNDDFLLGVDSNDTKNPFMLIQIRSIPDVFEKIRAWEGKMFLDLHGIFGMELGPENGYLLTEDFEDGFVENKNARILYKKIVLEISSGEEGSDRQIPVTTVEQKNGIALMYVFIDDTHILITDSEETTHEVITRLAGNSIKS